MLKKWNIYSHFIVYIFLWIYCCICFLCIAWKGNPTDVAFLSVTPSPEPGSNSLSQWVVYKFISDFTAQINLCFDWCSPSSVFFGTFSWQFSALFSILFNRVFAELSRANWHVKSLLKYLWIMSLSNGAKRFNTRKSIVL